MKLRAKLLLGFLGIALLTAILGLIGIVGLNRIKAADELSYSTGTMGVVGTQAILSAFDMIKVAIRDEALSTGEEENKAALAAYNSGVSEMEAALKAYSATFTNDVDRANFAKLSETWTAYHGMTDKVMELGIANKNAEAAALMRGSEMAKARADIAAATDTITKFNETNVRLTNEANTRLANGVILLMGP